MRTWQLGAKETTLLYNLKKMQYFMRQSDDSPLFQVGDHDGSVIEAHVVSMAGNTERRAMSARTEVIPLSQEQVDEYLAAHPAPPDVPAKPGRNKNNPQLLKKVWISIIMVSFSVVIPTWLGLNMNLTGITPAGRSLLLAPLDWLLAIIFGGVTMFCLVTYHKVDEVSRRVYVMIICICMASFFLVLGEWVHLGLFMG